MPFGLFPVGCPSRSAVVPFGGLAMASRHSCRTVPDLFPPCVWEPVARLSWCGPVVVVRAALLSGASLAVGRIQLGLGGDHGRGALRALGHGRLDGGEDADRIAVDAKREAAHDDGRTVSRPHPPVSR